MPLKLVTGPANSGKAGAVLGQLRARLEADPILVVPSFQDVEHSQRELAERGVVFGARVVRFDRLFRSFAERSGYGEPLASALQRDLIVEEAIRGARLRVLAPSARQPGFVRAAASFVAELERSMIDPARLTRALLEWAAEGSRRRYAQEIAAIYRGYRERLDAVGLVDGELFAWRALDALRREPARWRRTPVFVYGFDDFTPLELDALETLSGRAEADVVVSLPFEPGREAFRAVASAHERLAALASERLVLEAVADHYEDGSRSALYHLERRLFEVEPEPDRRPGGPAVRLHTAGGERAEVELVAAQVLRALREGTPPGEVAVVFRQPGRYASVIEQVFGAYGIPFSVDHAVPLSHTGLGRALLALIRCALLEGSSEDLLIWLRAPGKLRQAGLADELEREARGVGVESAIEARGLWEARRWPLDELDRLAAAPDSATLLVELDHQLQRLFSGPYRRRAALLHGPELNDVRSFTAAHDALAELHALATAGPALRLDARRVHDSLAELRVRVGEEPQPDRVQVSTPEAIRARRFQVLFLCGLQEGEFPRRSAPEPFLPDGDRSEIALPLPLREDQLDRERYLFYVCASRAEGLLVLSSRYCDEEGEPESRSFFVDDATDLLEVAEVRRRSLSEVTWSPEDAPSSGEWERSIAARGPRREPAPPGPLTAPVLLEALGRREVISAGALERFADCPVKWLVESFLRPEALEPDPEQMVRGRYAHVVLERTYARLREETGDRRPTLGNLPVAERILLEELRERRADFRLSSRQTRVRAAVRRLEFDLLSYLRRDAESDSLFEPEHLELSFGGDGGAEAVEIAEGVRVRGRIDRVDVLDGQAIVRDYKTGKSADGYRVALWEEKNRFQAALYMLAVRRLLGLEPVGGLYVPLGSPKKARGMVAADVEEVGSDLVAGDRIERPQFDERLEWGRRRIVATATAVRAGELRCTPDSCAYDGGCAYPTICRVER